MYVMLIYIQLFLYPYILSSFEPKMKVVLPVRMVKFLHFKGVKKNRKWTPFALKKLNLTRILKNEYQDFVNTI